MEEISQNEFCRRLNWSLPKIQAAVEQGIVKSFRRYGKKILYKWPDAGNEFLAAFPSRKGSVKQLTNSTRVEKSRSIDLVEESGLRPETIPTPEEPNVNTVPAKSDNLEPGNVTEAERRKKFAEARLAEIKLSQALGELVDVKEVNKNLFAFGVEVKNAVLSVPDRIVDDILASDSRNEALLIMNNALNKALKSLSEAGNRKLVKDE